MTPNRGVLFAVYSTCICLVESGVPDTLKVQEVFSVLWVLYLVEILRCNKTELQGPQIFKRPYQKKLLVETQESYTLSLSG